MLDKRFASLRAVGFQKIPGLRSAQRKNRAKREKHLHFDRLRAGAGQFVRGTCPILPRRIAGRHRAPHCADPRPAGAAFCDSPPCACRAPASYRRKIAYFQTLRAIFSARSINRSNAAGRGHETTVGAPVIGCSNAIDSACKHIRPGNIARRSRNFMP